jgi:hypothetical protein
MTGKRRVQRVTLPREEVVAAFKIFTVCSSSTFFRRRSAISTAVAGETPSRSPLSAQT